MPPIAKLFLAPLRGLVWIARELHSAADRERRAEEDALMQSLYALHLRLERGEIDEPQFAAEEAVLLERIDLLKLRRP